MGHRAIVAYERQDGLFNCHYSHWGAHDLKLADEITEATPLGGDKSEPEFVTAFTAMLDDAVGEDAEISGEVVEASETTDVESQPFAAGLRMSEVVEQICHVMHEAFYVVDRDFDVHAFRTIHIPFGADDKGLETNSPGLLIESEPHRDRDGPVYGEQHHRQGKFRGIREMLEAFTGSEGTITDDKAREVARSIADGDTLDLSEVVSELQARADDFGAAQLFTPEAAREVMIHKIIADFDGSLGTRVLSYSPLLNEEHLADYPHAFARLQGRTRVLGSMHATEYRNDSVQPWMINDALDLPAPVDGGGLPSA